MPTRSGRSSGSRANPAVRFINGLAHTGDWDGKPFDLRPWQERIITAIFDETGRARYRRVFIALPRKQGKTELISAILLYLMFGTGRRGQQIYSASGDRKQAALIHKAAARMVWHSRALRAVARVYDGYKRIECKPLDAVYEALSSEAPLKHGLRPSVLLFDELHVLPNRELWTALTSAFGATLEPLTIMITTAGYDRTSLCWEQWEYARGVRDGTIEDPDFLPVIYEAEADADWTDEDTWRAAMPALGDFCQLEWVRSECRLAQKIPAYENAFRQLLLNQWTEQATRWLQTARWAEIGSPIALDALEGRPCYGGLDLGVTGDMSVYVELFADDRGGCRVLAQGFAPRDGKWRREQRNVDRYLAWERAGHLTFTDGDATDHQVIEDFIVDRNRRHPIRSLYADRAYATQILNRLYNAHKIPVKGIAQGPLALNEPMTRLEELILAGRINHGNNPILAWNVGNAVMRRGATGLMYLDKSHATERIDGLAALLDALAALINDGVPAPKPSIYNTRGIFTVG
jgi:phage terminase large subunit-like protein